MAGETAARRQRLFDLFVNQPGHRDLTERKQFWCPLCRRPFTREDTVGDPPTLTLAHIIPECQGGTWMTLCCRACNNDNGHEIERDFLTSQKISDWIHGRGTIPVRLGDGRKVKAEMSRDPERNHIQIDILTPMRNPAVVAHKEKMVNAAAGESFDLTLPWFRDGWWRATVCQSAYLLMFKYFGYDFARCATYNYLRDQVLDPDNDCPGFLYAEFPPQVAAQLLEGKQAAVIFVREPMKLILAVMRFTSPGKADQYLAVPMSGPGESPLSDINLSGAAFSSVIDDVEATGRWRAPFWEEWRHWLNT